MHRLRVVPLIKTPWTLAVSPNVPSLCYGMTKYETPGAPYFALPSPTMRMMHLTRITSVVATDEYRPNVFKRIRGRFINFLRRHKYKRQAFYMFENMVDNINFNDFFTDFKMPDTFYSWFVITELHIWMLILRLMEEGQQGQELRNGVVDAFWMDIDRRKTKLKNANAIALKYQTNELSEQFNAAIIGYDEGIMSDDKVLAAAIWRRFFQCECNNPEHLEQLVIYIRKQIYEFDRVPSNVLLATTSTKWVDYRQLKPVP